MYLNCHSYYSLRYGMLSIGKLVSGAVSLGIGSLALTDINNTMGVVDFVKECRRHGLRPVAGVEFRNHDKLMYVCLARNNKGFGRLNQLLTRHNLDGTPFPERMPAMPDVAVIYPAGALKPGQLLENEYLGIRLSQVPRLLSSELRHRQDKLVMLQPVTFSDEHSWYIHKNLRAIDHNTLLSKLLPSQHAAADEMLLPPASLRAAFVLYPQLLETTARLMEECEIDFDFSTIKNRKTFTGNAKDDRELLQKLAFDGLVYRYGADHPEARKRVEGELAIIDKLGFSAYFLITWDVIRYSMSRGFYHVGRGSGANSIVAYCLRITDVDPIELDLYFERFLNPKRTSPPDFDIDYSWKEREDVFV